jgi:hypothetical protein
MGQEIVYCVQCQRRITGAEFDIGQAFQIGNNLVCSTCAAAVLPSLDLTERDRLLQQMFKATRDRRSTSTASLPSVRAPLAQKNADARKTTRSIPLVKTPLPRPAVLPRANPVPTFIAATFIGAAFVMVLIWVGSSKSAPPPEPQEAVRTRVPARTALPSAAEAPAPDPRESAARDAVRRAEIFQERSPQDADGAVRLWEAAVKLADSTPLAGDVRVRLAAAQRRRQEAFERELTTLDEQALVPLGKHDYKGAWDVYKSATGRHDHPDWEFALEKRTRETYQAASKQLPALKSQAADSARKRDSAALREARERVVSWGFPELVSELDRAIATAAAEAPPETPAEPGPPWRSLLKGRWIDELVKANCGWKMEDGALVGEGDSVRPARTWEDFASGEIRVRFELSGTTFLFFNVRQGADGHTGVDLDRRTIESMGSGEHVVVLTFRQGPVTATLDGNPISVQRVRNPTTGALQFCPAHGRLKVRTIEYRP